MFTFAIAKIARHKPSFSVEMSKFYPTITFTFYTFNHSIPYAAHDATVWSLGDGHQRYTIRHPPTDASHYRYVLHFSRLGLQPLELHEYCMENERKRDIRGFSSFERLAGFWGYPRPDSRAEQLSSVQTVHTHPIQC